MYKTFSKLAMNSAKGSLSMDKVAQLLKDINSYFEDEAGADDKSAILKLEDNGLKEKGAVA